MNKRDVLIIDDEPVVAQAVSRVCVEDHLSVDIVPDASTGLSHLQSSTYRLIVCDIMMPGLDGFAFLAELSSRKIISPVIMTTGYSTLENAVRSLTCGAIDFLAKPFTADELLAVIRRGLKYETLQMQVCLPNGLAPQFLSFVPCPARYYRLGYVSWAYLEHEGTALVGITDLFFKTLDEVRAIDVRAVETEVYQGSSFASIVSTDGLTHGVLGPLSGRIVEINTAAVNAPVTLEKDPYFSGWLYRVLPCALSNELKHLISCSSDRL